MTHLALTTLSEDELMFRDSVRKFAQNEIKPFVHQMDTEQKILDSVKKGCFDLGIMGIEVEEVYNGTGANFFTSILTIEAIAEVDPAVSVFVDVQNTLVINAIRRWGTEDQKKRYLTKLAQEWVGSYALSEAGSGSDAFALACRAEDKGDHWLLHGNKLWITNGADSSLFIVFANVNPELGYKGITGFLVEKDFEGFTVGKKEDKLGIRASSTTELIFDACKVPKENVLGEIGKGYKVAIETLNEGRIGIGAQMLGLAQGAYDLALSYTLERKQFGKRIADFQGVQFQLAELATGIEASRLLVYNAARLKDAGLPFIKEAAMAKLFSSQIAEKAASRAVELHGGVGFTKEYPVEKFFRDSKIGAIYEGTTNLQLQTIAKMELAAKS